jgi:branched-chain amino acid transport system permease protein
MNQFKANALGYLPLVCIFIFILVGPPFLKNDYLLHLGIMIGINLLLALGMRLILLIGQVSFAHAGFMAIGAYTSAMLSLYAGLSAWLAMSSAGLMAALIAVLFGYPTLRIKGAYFFITSFAFTEIILLVVTHWIEPFGGPTGLTSVPRLNPIIIPGVGSIRFLSETSYFYLILVIVSLALLMMYRIDKARLGLTIRAIGQMDILAQSAGIDLMKHKVMVFAIGSFWAGIAGSFYAHYTCYVGPGNFASPLGLNILVYAVFGGVGSVFGPVVGTAIFTILPEVTRMAKFYEPIFFGASLVLAVLFLPEGLITLPAWFRKWFGKVSQETA